MSDEVRDPADLDEETLSGEEGPDEAELEEDEDELDSDDFGADSEEEM